MDEAAKAVLQDANRFLEGFLIFRIKKYSLFSSRRQELRENQHSTNGSQ